MSEPFFDPSRVAALAERLEAAGLAAEADTVELPPDRLSGVELRLWFIDQFEPATAVYTIAAGLRLRGTLDVDALRRAVPAVAARHEALRCRFPTVSGIPSAVVDPDCRTELTVEPVSGGDAVRWAEERARVPFDLAEGPLFRVALGRLDDDDHVLMIAIHHIVVDGAGLDIVLRELLSAYLGAPLPADVDRRRVCEPTAERERIDLDFWRGELAGLPPELSIMRDRERPLVPTRRGGRLRAEVDPGVRTAVAACARGLGTTPAVVYHAAYRCLLALLADDDDLAIGCPVNLRESAEGDAVGNFVNTLVVRTRLPGDPTFAKAATAVAGALARALDHRRLGFEKLVQALAPAREASRSPLFQVSFAHHVSPLPAAASFAHLHVEPLAVETGTAMFDLGLQVAEWRDSASVHLAYAADLYDEATARRLLDAYQRIIGAVAARPDLRLSELPLLEPADEAQVLVHAAAGALAVDDPFGIAGRVAAAAADHPDAAAVRVGGRTVSYKELDARSIELAAAVDALELPPEAPVALLLERGLDLVAAMVACARVGRPYIPLDDEHPPARIALVLEAARPGALIGSRQLVARLDCPLPALIDPASVHGGASPLRPLPPETALYTIFTSGSTGRPKGVVVTHRNLLALLDAARPLFDYGPDDVWTLFFSCAFDFSVWEIWAPLTTGGRVVVLDRALARDPVQLRETLERERVTILNQTPSAFRSFQQALLARADRPPASLRLVVFGGEALLVAELRSWFELVGADGPRLVNMYGITETTVHVTAVDVEPATTVKSPIGVPLAHLSAVVLDRRFRVVPVGVAGELFVGGLGLARGYAGQPGLTAARFVPDPFSDGGRLYRTGDRVRWLADGSLEFLGRVDDQLKVRGFRVEPGEVEAALAAVEGVVGAAVVEREGRLVAFVVGDVDTAAVRRALAARLPDYLVPSLITTLAELPLTANGKVDRRALPAPSAERVSDVDYVAPRGDVEEVLASAFASVLGLERVGALDNFFDLGGDSIRAVRVAALAGESGVAVTVADLFTHPVVAELAECATAPVDGAPVTEPFALVAPEDRIRLPEGVVDAYPLGAMQAGMLFHQEFGDERPAYHNVTSLEIRARLDIALFRAAADRVYARHPVLRTSFDLGSYSEPLQLVWASVTAPVEVHDIRGLARVDQERAVNDWMAEIHRVPRPLDEPPLLALHVHHAADDFFWLSSVECHAILDGWSFNATIGEILETYATLLAGEDLPPPPEPAVAFREHVAAERAALGDEAHAAYFAELLADAPRTQVASPGGARGGKETGFRRRLIVLPPPVQRRVETSARECGVPVKSVLLAAHVAVVGVLARTDDVVTGLILNGRPERAGGDDVRGMYLNNLPLRLSIAHRTFRQLAAGAATREAELWRHRLYPGAALRGPDGRSALSSSDFVYNRFWPLGPSRGAGEVELLGNPRELADASTPLAASWDHDAREPGEHLALMLEFARASFSEEEVDGITALYKRMLAALADDLDTRVDEVPLLDPDEEPRLHRWNATARSYADAGSPLHVLVERTARAHGNRIAVVAPGRTLTYAELDAEANRLARVLRRRGIGVDGLVGVAVGRCWELPVALLATLKAGGAFVPIDPAFPEERRALMAAETCVQEVLDDAVLAAALAEAAAEESTAPQVSVPSEAACYVMFTSGSTGRPKGVVVPHRAIVNRLLSMQERYGLTDDDAVLQKTSTSFDVSVSELFWPLVAGGRVVVAEPGAERDPAALIATIERERVTVCDLVPPMVRALLDTVLPGRCQSLRLVLVGGEALPTSLASDWRARFSARLENAYGPTETAVDVSFCSADGPVEGPTVPIGLPHANTELHVLSPALAAVPSGVAGELYVGGVQLARGYHGRPGLTAARFVPNLHGPPGSRLYRTGDLARRLASGAVVWLGRVDDQLKVRGFRVEPGEVEAALLAFEGVVGAAVAQREGRLVGFVVGDVDPAAVRRSLAERLPDYLVPSLIVMLPELPLTANGKLDRRGLPVPLAERVADVEYMSPQGRVEEVLAAAFASVLGLERVGALDNFFELGGDSILALTCAFRVRAEGLQVSPRLIFEYQTIAEIAPHCVFVHPLGPAAAAGSDGPDLSESGLDEAAAAALLERAQEAWR
jgi:amino acid adenylation domain-containing protein